MPLKPGDRVYYQSVDPDTGRFGPCDKHDTGTVIRDHFHPWGSYNITPCLSVLWDRVQPGCELQDVDVITDTGCARSWAYRVNVFTPHG